MLPLKQFQESRETETEFETVHRSTALYPMLLPRSIVLITGRSYNREHMMRESGAAARSVDHRGRGVGYSLYYPRPIDSSDRPTPISIFFFKATTSPESVDPDPASLTIAGARATDTGAPLPAPHGKGPEQQTLAVSTHVRWWVDLLLALEVSLPLPHVYIARRFALSVHCVITLWLDGG